jgi:perosamine synthetase
MKVEKISILYKENIQKALEKINDTALGILFVIDEDEIMLGIVTDGDIRRALLKNGSILTTLNEVMNVDFFALNINVENNEIIKCFSTRIKVIPLLNSKGQIVDYATINKLKYVPISAPFLNGNELAYVTECINTNWISSQGKYVGIFEEMFSKRHLCYESISVCNGTVALHLAFEALGICEGDEVLVSNFTFVASINSILYSRAVPVLVDINSETLNIDVDLIEQKITSKTKAILVVHLYGLPSNMDEIIKLSKKYNLFIIEDCAEALGSLYNKQPVGTFGDASTFSFYGNKTITTGEGGMVLFKNKDVADKARILRDHGMDKNKRYWHNFIGYNYRMTNIQAAIGVAQFEQLDEFILKKREIASTYNNFISKFDYFNLPFDTESCYNTYWLYTIIIQDHSPFSRDEMIDFLKSNGIETRPVFYPINIMPPYLNYGKPEDLKISNNISLNGISLPSSVNLDIKLVDYIGELISKFCNSYKG